MCQPSYQGSPHHPSLLTKHANLPRIRISMAHLQSAELGEYRNGFVFLRSLKTGSVMTYTLRIPKWTNFLYPSRQSPQNGCYSFSKEKTASIKSSQWVRAGSTHFHCKHMTQVFRAEITSAPRSGYKASLERSGPSDLQEQKNKALAGFWEGLSHHQLCHVDMVNSL
jgi:hypothetical protein